jgi:hypothetical protein
MRVEWRPISNSWTRRNRMQSRRYSGRFTRMIRRPTWLESPKSRISQIGACLSWSDRWQMLNDIYVQDHGEGFEGLCCLKFRLEIDLGGKERYGSWRRWMRLTAPTCWNKSRHADAAKLPLQPGPISPGPLRATCC